MLDQGLGDAGAVEQGAVGAAEIVHVGVFAHGHDQGVSPADGEIVELDVVAVLAADADAVLVDGKLPDNGTVEGHDELAHVRLPVTSVFDIGDQPAGGSPAVAGSVASADSSASKSSRNCSNSALLRAFM